MQHAEDIDWPVRPPGGEFWSRAAKANYLPPVVSPTWQLLGRITDGVLNLIFQLLAGPFIGAAYGGLAGGVAAMLTLIVLVLMTGRSASLLDVLAGSVVTAIAAVLVGFYGFLYGVVCGGIAGACAAPLTFFARKEKLPELVIVMGATISISSTILLLDPFPYLHLFFLLTVASCTVGAGAVVWILGRDPGQVS